MTTLDSRPAGTRRSTGAAQALEQALRPFVAGDLQVRLRAWDGSEAGPADAPLVVVSSPRALTRLLWSPGELGAAQAYVLGEIDVPGDLDAALTHVWSEVAARGLSGVRPTAAAVARAARTAAGSAPWVRGPLHRPPRRGSGAGCTASRATGR